MSSEKRCQIVVVTAEKGGTAKTTTAVHVGAALAGMDADILLVDTDPQGHVATALGMEAEPGVFNVLVAQMPPANCIRVTAANGHSNKLFLLPGNQKTKTAAAILGMQLANRELQLRDVGEMLRALAGSFDYMVVDTPANSILQEAALSVADVVLIPTALDFLAMTGVAKTLQNLAKLNLNSPRTLIVPTLYDRRLGEHNYNLGLLESTYPGQVVTPIAARAAMRECAAYGKTIFEYDKACAAAAGYMALAQEVFAPGSGVMAKEEHDARIFN